MKSLYIIIITIIILYEIYLRYFDNSIKENMIAKSNQKILVKEPSQISSFSLVQINS